MPGKQHPPIETELTVGQVAARSGVAVSTLHFYEAKGLIHSWRNAGNQRRYPREVLRRVAVIKVAQRTGMTQQDAEKRVNDVYAKAQAALRDAQAKAKQAADAARKASAYTALWLVVSMLIGAFFASFAATYGGRRRDL